MDLIKHLKDCIDDPMWPSHCEMSKYTIRRIIAEVEELRESSERMKRAHDELWAAYKKAQQDMLDLASEKKGCYHRFTYDLPSKPQTPRD